MHLNGHSCSPVKGSSCIGMGGELFLTSWGKPSTNRCAETSSWNVSRAETGNAINYPPSVVLPVCGSCNFIRCCCSCCYYCCCCHCWFKNKHNIHSSKGKPALPSSKFNEEAALAVNLWNNEICEYCSGKYDILVTLSVCVCVSCWCRVGVCVRNLKPKAACWTQHQQQALYAGTSMANIQPAALGFSQNGRWNPNKASRES